MSQLNNSRDLFEVAAKQLQGLLEQPVIGLDEAARINTRILVGLLKGNRAALEGYMAALDETIRTLETATPEKQGTNRKIEVK